MTVANHRWYGSLRRRCSLYTVSTCMTLYTVHDIPSLSSFTLVVPVQCRGSSTGLATSLSFFTLVTAFSLSCVRSNDLCCLPTHLTLLSQSCTGELWDCLCGIPADPHVTCIICMSRCPHPGV